MNGREIRAHLCEVRAAPANEGSVVFSGYAAKFNRWSEDLGGFREQIAPGAFADSIGVDDVRCLLNHDPNKVLGRSKAGSGTLKLAEDSVGLRFEVQAPDVGWVRDMAESVRRGDIDQCSFGFMVEEQEWVFKDVNGRSADERTIRRAKLFDVSIVTYPAYPDTEAGVRGGLDAHKEACEEHAKEKAHSEIEMRRKRLKVKELENHE